MIVYYSFIAWVLLMWLCFSRAGKPVCDPSLYGHKPVKLASTGVAVMTFAYMCFWIGMRTAFVDTAAYIASFDAFTPSWEYLADILEKREKGYGFAILMWIFKFLISDNPQAWLMFVALVCCGCVMYAFKRFSPFFFFTTLIYILSCSFSWAMNGIRQYLCVTVLFACAPLLIRKKWVPLILITLILSTIHQTCLIMLPIFFVAHTKPWSKWMLLSVAGTLTLCSWPGLIADSADVILQHSDYSNLSDSFGSGVNPIRTAFFSIPAILAIIYRKRLAALKSPIVDICINMSIITACLYCIGSVTSGIMMGRLPIYCQLYSYILVAYVMKEAFRPGIRQIAIASYLVLFYIFFMVQSQNFYYQSSFTGRIY